MAKQVIQGLDIKQDGTYLDCTVGGAGHSALIAQCLTNGRLICVDKDADAIKVSKERLKDYNFVSFIQKDYNNLQDELLFENFDGILIDLGVSSYQIDNAQRGFSFNANGPLDMRMDKRQTLDAQKVVNTYSQQQLAKILFEYGEENFAKQIAKNIVAVRTKSPIKTTKQLCDIIDMSVPSRYKYQGAYKKTFQAIRIEVNNELANLEKTLQYLVSKLKPNGRICVITFHSLEDRIVKNVFKELSTQCVCPPKTPICICGHKAEIKLVSKKPILPTTEELLQNSRSHSAKLRIAQKL